MWFDKFRKIWPTKKYFCTSWWTSLTCLKDILVAEKSKEKVLYNLQMQYLLSETNFFQRRLNFSALKLYQCKLFSAQLSSWDHFIVLLYYCSKIHVKREVCFKYFKRWTFLEVCLILPVQVHLGHGDTIWLHCDWHMAELKFEL